MPTKFKPLQDGENLCHGESFASAVQLCNSHPNVTHIGINCTNPRDVTALLKSARNLNFSEPKPYVVYPNSGEDYDHEAKYWIESKEKFDFSNDENAFFEWADLGAKIIGGCCRVFADDIANIGRIVEKYNRVKSL